LLLPMVSVPFTVTLEMLFVFVLTVTVCPDAIITTSPAAGSPVGLHVLDDDQLPLPADVFVTALACTPTRIEKIIQVINLRTMLNRLNEMTGAKER